MEKEGEDEDHDEDGVGRDASRWEGTGAEWDGMGWSGMGREVSEMELANRSSRDEMVVFPNNRVVSLFIFECESI